MNMNMNENENENEDVAMEEMEEEEEEGSRRGTGVAPWPPSLRPGRFGKNNGRKVPVSLTGVSSEQLPLMPLDLLLSPTPTSSSSSFLSTFHHLLHHLCTYVQRSTSHPTPPPPPPSSRQWDRVLHQLHTVESLVDLQHQAVVMALNESEPAPPENLRGIHKDMGPHPSRG
ncbi:hypothetical protein HMI56_001639 [Coelomomyces lativittatus]|nr:hypothetical protein HMI56_001639 [Coelomomyces lativittatus]